MDYGTELGRFRRLRRLGGCVVCSADNRPAAKHSAGELRHVCWRAVLPLWRHTAAARTHHVQFRLTRESSSEVPSFKSACFLISSVLCCFAGLHELLNRFVVLSCDVLLPSAVHEGQNTRHAHRDAKNLFLLCFKIPSVTMPRLSDQLSFEFSFVVLLFFFALVFWRFNPELFQSVDEPLFRHLISGFTWQRRAPKRRDAFFGAIRG